MIMCISKFYSLFLHIIKDLNAVCSLTLSPHLSDNFWAVLEQASLTLSITLVIIIYRNIVIFKRWHYSETYKTDKSIFDMSQTEFAKQLNVTFQTVGRTVVPYQINWHNQRCLIYARENKPLPWPWNATIWFFTQWIPFLLLRIWKKSIIRNDNSFWICNMVLENIDKTYEKYWLQLLLWRIYNL